MEQILKHNFISGKYCSDSLYEDAFLFAAGVLTGIMVVPYEAIVNITDSCFNTTTLWRFRNRFFAIDIVS